MKTFSGMTMIGRGDGDRSLSIDQQQSISVTENQTAFLFTHYSNNITNSCRQEKEKKNHFVF